MRNFLPCRSSLGMALVDAVSGECAGVGKGVGMEQWELEMAGDGWIYLPEAGGAKYKEGRKEFEK